MEITSEQVKALRDETGVSIMQCKKALEEAGGDKDKAQVLLRKKGEATVAKKSDRALGAGIVGSYVHATKEVAALVNLSCETDFVSKNEEFVALARDIAMHITAQNPQFISREEVSEKDLENAREIFAKEVADKPEEIQEKILSGKMDSYFKDFVLMEQAFIKDPEETIGGLITSAIQKFGENISIVEISRISVK